MPVDRPWGHTERIPQSAHGEAGQTTLVNQRQGCSQNLNGIEFLRPPTAALFACAPAWSPVHPAATGSAIQVRHALTGCHSCRTIRATADSKAIHALSEHLGAAGLESPNIQSP
jgi:hypothetical protein